ncbi:AVAST type 2 anti-phage system protein Avs2 [Priestia megaterium]|uniref:AVAST type 2 anti-phage system protein Avs2 n=1 Tax=Priestia megaterium TaxID=1404 RepID=UPI002E245328|nr:hypothetical protein [Priestia megaterium]
MNNLNWVQIRSFNNSQDDGFEELVCQLARAEFSSSNNKFIRKGKPDAGVECFCILEDGKEIGVQAKYFLSSLQETQWKQVDKSIETVLEKHPNITKYIIAFPIDPADARITNKESMLQKWERRNEKWRGWAEKRGMNVEFIPWWSSDLITRLQKTSNAGMVKFWFNEQEFTDEWFTEQIEGAIEDLGKRYTPELNFELNLMNEFSGIYRDELFKKQFEKVYDKFLKEFNKNLKLPANHELNEFKEAINKSLAKINELYEDINFSEMQKINYSLFSDQIEEIKESIMQVQNIVERDNPTEEQNKNLGISSKKAEYLSQLRSLFQKIQQFKNFLESKTVQLSNLPVAILKGEAGSGKSHLLADMVRQRNLLGKKSLLLLGQHFTGDQSPWQQILNNCLRLNCNESEFLGALNAKAQSMGSRIIIYIDALNEGKGKYFWNEHIRSFIKSFIKYKWLGLVMSIRTSYVELIAPPDEIGDDRAIRLTHWGFLDVEYEASKLFFDNYEIEQPAIPLLHTEFSNPLFLKMFCEGLKKANLKRIPEGYEGITNIMSFYLSGANKQLARPNRMNYSAALNLVHIAIQTIIENKINNDLKYIPYIEAYQLIETEMQKFNIKGGFLNELISEGILTKNLFWKNSKESEEGIYLVYERFEDHLVASYLIEKYLNKENPYESFKEGGSLFSLVKNESACYLNKGIIEALCIQLPEQVGKEFYELAPHCKETFPVIKCFIESLIWRRTDTITDKLIDYINECVNKYDDTFNQFLDTIITVTSNHDHYFNADFLHEHLMKFSMADRDAWWSIYISSQFDEPTAVKRLIDWAWSTSEKNFSSDETIRLTSKTLSWFLVTSNRFLRDAATKALIALLKNKISILLSLLEDFREVDDPYIYERLYCVAYGCALKTNDENLLKDLSIYIYKTIFDTEEVYPHILLRDYSRGVIEYTSSKNIDLDIDMQKVRPPYKSIWNYDVPSNEEIKQYLMDSKASEFEDYFWSQNEIVRSMQTEYSNIYMYGDFGRYVFQSALREFKDLDVQELSNIATKRIFELGYDVKKHGKFDRYYSGVKRDSRSTRKSERIGKKYQWLAFYEVMAKVTDKFTMYDNYSFEDQVIIPFTGPWKPYVRDIDPSLNIKTTEKVSDGTLQGHWWFNLEYNDWKYTDREWLKVKENIPNPSEIIEVKDMEGNEWLALESYPEWTEKETIGEDRWNRPHKRLWYQIRSYVVHQEEYDKTIEWAERQNFMGRWMPENHSKYEIYYREYFWSPAYRKLKEAYEETIWKAIESYRSKEIISEVHITTESLLWEEQYDCSKDESISFLMPSKMIFDELELNFGENEGEFINKGEVVCFDPSVYNKTHSCLLINKKIFVDFLKENKLKVFWSVLGEKNIIGGNAWSEDDFKRMEISGVYKLNEDNVRGNLNFY